MFNSDAEESNSDAEDSNSDVEDSDLSQSNKKNIRELVEEVSQSDEYSSELISEIVVIL